MKVLLLTLLLCFLLCSNKVLTLRCYTCADDSDCKTETECSASSEFCRTYTRGDTLSRTCGETCDPDYFTTCCQEDLCN